MNNDQHPLLGALGLCRKAGKLLHGYDRVQENALRGKAPGRGAYLCPSAACLAKARKAKRLERTFEVPIPDGIYDRLTEEIACAEQSAKEAASHE